MENALLSYSVYMNIFVIAMATIERMNYDNVFFFVTGDCHLSGRHPFLVGHVH